MTTLLREYPLRYAVDAAGHVHEPAGSNDPTHRPGTFAPKSGVAPAGGVPTKPKASVKLANSGGQQLSPEHVAVANQQHLQTVHFGTNTPRIKTLTSIGETPLSAEQHDQMAQAHVAVARNWGSQGNSALAQAHVNAAKWHVTQAQQRSLPENHPVRQLAGQARIADPQGGLPKVSTVAPTPQRPLESEEHQDVAQHHYDTANRMRGHGLENAARSHLVAAKWHDYQSKQPQPAQQTQQPQQPQQPKPAEAIDVPLPEGGYKPFDPNDPTKPHSAMADSYRQMVAKHLTEKGEPPPSWKSGMPGKAWAAVKQAGYGNDPATVDRFLNTVNMALRVTRGQDERQRGATWQRIMGANFPEKEEAQQPAATEQQPAASAQQAPLPDWQQLSQKVPLDEVLALKKKNADMRLPRPGQTPEDNASYAWNDRKAKAVARTHENKGYHRVDIPVEMLETNEREVDKDRLQRLKDSGGSSDPIFVGIDRHMGTNQPVLNVEDGNNRAHFAKMNGQKTIPAYVTPHDENALKDFYTQLQDWHAKQSAGSGQQPAPRVDSPMTPEAAKQQTPNAAAVEQQVDEKFNGKAPQGEVTPQQPIAEQPASQPPSPLSPTGRGEPATPSRPREIQYGAVYNVPTNELHVDPKRFQYKLDTNNPHGVTDELKGVKTFNPDFGGVISVWRDPQDGKDYVCVDEDTEILTTGGWRRWDSIAAGDQTLTLNHVTGKSEWQPITAVNVYPPRDRDMLLMEGKSHSSLTTLDHKWPVVYLREGCGKTTSAARRWRTSATLTCWDAIVLAAECDNLPTREVYSDDLVALVAWSWTEGDISGKLRRNMNISQSHVANPIHCESICGSLRSLFGPAKQTLKEARIPGTGGVSYAAEPAWIEYRLKSYPKMSSFRMTAAASKHILDHLDSSKIVKPEFLTSLTKRQLSLFVERCIDGDGHRGRMRVFVQKSEYGTKMFQMACAMLGLRTCANWNDHPTQYGSGVFHTTISKEASPKTIRPVRRSRRTDDFRMEVVTHHGMVWCPTTINGSWLARRNGTAYYTGNCNGHHRYELAARTGHPHMAVRYLNVPDERKARALGAAINIAEGRGTAVDASKWMRDSGVTQEDMEKHGISLKGKVAKDAVVLNHLNDRLFDRVARGLMNTDQAIAVARHLHDPDLQDKLANLLDRREEAGKDTPLKVIEEMAREMAETPKADAEDDGGLFSDISSQESLFTERNELKSFVRGELSREVNDFLAVANKNRAQRVGKAGNVLNPEENRRIARETERVLNVFNTLVNRKGEISDAMNTMAKASRMGKTKKVRDAIKRQALDFIRDTIFREAGLNREGMAPQGSPAGDATERAAGAPEVPADGGGGSPEPVGVKESQPAEHKPPLPPVGGNYIRPLSDFSPKLYRETDIASAQAMLPGTNLMGEGGDVYVANTPELALGQGQNKGVMLEFDSGNLNGRVNLSKPSAPFAYNQGQAEFIVRHQHSADFQKNLHAVTIKPDAQASPSDRGNMQRLLARLEQQGWRKEPLPDGSVRYTRPDDTQRRTNQLTLAEQMHQSYQEARKRKAKPSKEATND